MGLPPGEAMPVTVAAKVASVPLDANNGFVGPTRVVEVGPAGTMSLKVTEPMEGAARNESASVYVAPGFWSTEEDNAAETGQARPDANALVDVSPQSLAASVNAPPSVCDVPAAARLPTLVSVAAMLVSGFALEP